MRIQAQALPTGVNRIEGGPEQHAVRQRRGHRERDVAVIDTGIDVDNPELNVVGGRNCSTGSTFDDGNGHGTHVAGTIGARDNAVGVVGVAPGVRLFAVRVLDNFGSGTNSTVLCGIDFVDSRSPAKGGTITVANMSIGGPGADDGACGSIDGDVVHAAICRATADGVTFVAAAGNANRTFDGQIPAAYDEVLTVTAIDRHERAAGRRGPRRMRWRRRRHGGGLQQLRALRALRTPPTPSRHPGHASTRPGRAASTGGCPARAWRPPTSRARSRLCIATARCAGLTPAQIVQKVRADADARPLSYGFVGDPSRPIVDPGGTTRFYGHLLYVAGY